MPRLRLSRHHLPTAVPALLSRHGDGQGTAEQCWGRLTTAAHSSVDPGSGLSLASREGLGGVKRGSSNGASPQMPAHPGFERNTT